MTVTVHHGDCRKVLTTLPSESVDAVVTDPPYSLTDGGKKDCASDSLRRAIVQHAKNPNTQRSEGQVSFKISLHLLGRPMVRTVDLNDQLLLWEKEISDDRATGVQDYDVLVDELESMPGQQRISGKFRLWPREGEQPRCVAACRCLRHGSDGSLLIPVRLVDNSPGKTETPPGVVTLPGTEVTAVLSLDRRRRTGELLPASGADTIDPAFELLCPKGVRALTGAGGLTTPPESRGVSEIGGSANRAYTVNTFNLSTDDTLLSWRPTITGGFMSSLWDGTGIETDFRVWKECLRVMKPGAYLLAFGGTRTFHRLASAIEDAGFEIRDSIAWMHSNGLPKSKGHMKPAHEPIIVARKPFKGSAVANVAQHGTGNLNIDATRIPSTDGQLAAKYASVKNAPAPERTVFGEDLRARGDGPLEPHPGGRWPANVVLDESMAVELDAQTIRNPESRPRINEPSQDRRYTDKGSTNFAMKPGVRGGSPDGRWPANVVLDQDMAAELDAQSGLSKSASSLRGERTGDAEGDAIYGGGKGPQGPNTLRGHDDSGGASRFFLVTEGLQELTAPFIYVPKASGKERPKVDGAIHTTVKPLALMRWLLRLAVPPGGTVLDPFAGSGTTLEAAEMEGLDSIGIEESAEFLPLIGARLARVGATA